MIGYATSEMAEAGGEGETAVWARKWHSAALGRLPPVQEGRGGDGRPFGTGAATYGGRTALDLIKNKQVQAILGPVTSMDASFVINLGDQAQVPIISFYASSPSLNSLRSSYFFQITQVDSSQVNAISSIVQNFGWRQVVPIYVDTEYGDAVIPFLTDALQEVDVRVTYRSAISPLATDDQILQELRVQTYVAQTQKLEEFNLRWKQQSMYDVDQLDVPALWAYDAAFALAMAIEEVGITTTFDLFQKNSSSSSFFNLTDFGSAEISKYGPDLCRALSITRFEGIAGNFSIVDGKLQSSTFRIESKTILSTDSKSNLKSSVIWPGESLSTPKGWEIPTNGKRLRIGVPVNFGVLEFVRVAKDPTSNTTEVTGFSIDVFKAAIEVLPYPLPYEFIPYEKPNGSVAATYNDLCYQVYLGKFDAVVGDVTIRAKRSLYVDFTMPYTESGIVMVVPIFDTRAKNAWSIESMKIFVALPRIKSAPVSGSPSQPWRESAQQFGKICDDHMGFDDSKLKGFTTVEEIQEALTKGSPNGGIAAFVDETPYTKLLLAKYCSKFTMVGPIFKTVGFGFVFPKRSPLVPDVSRAVLNVTEGDKILNIANKWFNKEESNCQDSGTQSVSSNSLGLASFWGLLLIAGLASILALIIFIASFLHKHKTMIPSDSGASRWRRLQIMFEIFNQKDLDSHTFKTSQERDSSVQSPVNNTFEEIPVNYNSSHTEIHSASSVSFEEHEIP
ncbi:hypothetical protein ACLB2K_013194 [Fragaria x ananassa]